MPIVIRVRWAGGYVEVSDDNNATGRRTIPFDAGNVKTLAKAIEVGQTVLQEWGTRPIRSWSGRIGNTPDWPAIGDRIQTFGVDGQPTADGVRLVSRRVSILASGHASLEPTLGTSRDLLVERNQRALKKLTDGLGGRSAASDPLLTDKDTGFAAGQMTERSVMSWANTGILVRKGPQTDLPETTILTRLQLLLSRNTQVEDEPPVVTPVILGDQLILNAYFDNVSTGAFSMPAGVSEYNYLLASGFPAGTKIQYTLLDAGAPQLNLSSTLAATTLTFNLYGVTGTWVQETNNDPEIR